MGKLLEALAISNIHPGWNDFLNREVHNILGELDTVYTVAIEAGKHVFPAPEDIFKVFGADPASVRCIILGQDPYHEVGQAMGLAFSVPNGTKEPPSLRNIKKEIREDIGDIDLRGTDLTCWARQGVFLLNTVLTVEEGKANSHAKKGWETVAHKAIQYLLPTSDGPLTAILWGAQAQKERDEILGKQALRPIRVFTSVHPSPLSARKGFFGSKPFSQVNAFLAEHGEKPIDWSIPG